MDPISKKFLADTRGMALPAVVFWLCLLIGVGYLIADVVRSKDTYDDTGQKRGKKYVSSTKSSSKGTVFEELGANLGLVKEAKWWDSPVKVTRENTTQVFVAYSSAKTKRKKNSGVASYYVDQGQ